MQVVNCHDVFSLIARYECGNRTIIANVALVNGTCGMFWVSQEVLSNFVFYVYILFRSGKTTFLTNLLLQWSVLYPNNPLRKICLIYSYDQPEYNRLRQAYGEQMCTAKTLSEKILSTEMLGTHDAKHPAMLIIDDSAWQLTNSPVLTSIFCGACHHLK